MVVPEYPRRSKRPIPAGEEAAAPTTVGLTAATLIALQRSAGNAATLALLQRSKDKVPTKGKVPKPQVVGAYQPVNGDGTKPAAVAGEVDQRPGPEDAALAGKAAEYPTTAVLDKYSNESTGGGASLRENLVSLALEGVGVKRLKTAMTSYGWTAADWKKHGKVTKTTYRRMLERLTVVRKMQKERSPHAPADVEADLFDIVKSQDLPNVEAVDKVSQASYALNLSPSIVRAKEVTPFDTSAMRSPSGDGYGIFVMSSDGTVYAGDPKVGLFHHSSLLSGSGAAGAGEMVVRKGRLVLMTNRSGHYQPGTAEMVNVFTQLKRYLNLSSFAYVHHTASRKPEPFPTAEQFYEQYKESTEGTAGTAAQPREKTSTTS